ncbi:MAG: heparinase II/III-family protein [Anaeromyxobacteraceae bacterium]
MTRIRNQIQELRELGVGGLAFRLKWELALRSGLAESIERPPLPLASDARPTVEEMVRRLPFGSAGADVASRDWLTPEARERLAGLAADAARGRVLAFGRWPADHGNPPDWILNPTTGERWNPETHWSRALRDGARVGDVKLTWEIARFPHAYHMARAATHGATDANVLATALAGQIEAFVRENPFGRGVHWNSSQEIVFRLMAWLFALSVFGAESPLARVAPAIVDALSDGAHHVERHIEYARKAVYNNHLLSEAFGLLLAAELLPAAPRAARWRATGLDLLVEQADRQFYPDGGYIQQSHNYERVALQVYLWAVALLGAAGKSVPETWRSALARGVDFLHAQQNGVDGRLPNYGSNDGALVSPLTSCDYADFRPTLHAASIAARGERLYQPGPWDEEAAWFLGAKALEAPVRRAHRASVSFGETGFHVLRGADEASFATFRCGSVRDRFSQIDMLHLDVWWRGENVLVDGGSYLYNGPKKWHDHFLRTASHNTVGVDGFDQMLHYRRFKTLYWTRAKLLRFQDTASIVLAEGEHYGYQRHPGACVHRRAVLYVKDDLWIVLDRVTGQGEHKARLHWLGGPYAHAYDPVAGRMTLTLASGDFEVTVLDERGAPLVGDVVVGSEDPPRGWLSRYYGEKVPVPSLAVERHGALPFFAVSLLSGGRPAVRVSSGRWSVATANGNHVSFRVSEGCFEDIEVERHEGHR